MVKFKEGDVLLLDQEQMETDKFQEAGFETDEATLFRLGGSALHSTLERNKYTKEHSILQRMQLLPHEKIDMPSNICHLDVHGGMVFMKKEFLGYLSQVNCLSPLVKVALAFALIMSRPGMVTLGWNWLWKIITNIVYNVHIYLTPSTCM